MMQKSYSYTALLDKARKKKTGYHLTLTDEVTTKAVTKASISLVQGDETFPANERGVILMELREGKYNYTIKKVVEQIKEK